MATWKEKDADATLDFALSWALWLDGDTIALSEWIVPVGLTEESDSHTDDTATIWLSGGTVDQYYRITNRITTAGGRINDQSVYIKVVDK